MANPKFLYPSFLVLKSSGPQGAIAILETSDKTNYTPKHSYSYIYASTAMQNLSVSSGKKPQEYLDFAKW